MTASCIAFDNPRTSVDWYKVQLIEEETIMYWLAHESYVILSLPCFVARTAREPHTSKNTSQKGKGLGVKNRIAKKERQKRVSPSRLVKDDNSRVMSKQCLMLARIKRDRGGILCMQDEKNELAID